MLRIVVDSGSSIKQEEKELYQAEILPIQVELSGESYLDGVNLDVDAFYEKLAASNDFPKTSLPSLEEAKELVESYTTKGDEVLVITISSEISGTYQALRMLFEENPKVAVFDCHCRRSGKAGLSSGRRTAFQDRVDGGKPFVH